MSNPRVMLRSSRYGRKGTVATGFPSTIAFGMGLHTTRGREWHVDCGNYIKLPPQFQDAPVGYKPKRFKLEGRYFHI